MPYNHFSTFCQKIDKLKSRLTSLVDLIMPHGIRDNVEGDLDDEEFQLLSEAGIISGSHRTKKGGQKPKHIIFVDSDDAGMFSLFRVASL